MKQETIDLLKTLAELNYKGHPGTSLDYSNGYDDGAYDAQIAISKRILKLEEIEEITS